MDSDALPLSRGQVDVDARRRNEPIESILGADLVRVVRVRDGLVDAEEDHLLFAGEVRADSVAVYLGIDEDGWTYVADLGGGAGVERDPNDDPQGAPTGVQLRDVGWLLSARDAGLAATSVALANWHARNPRCPRCGALTEVQAAGWERRCIADDSVHYPRTDAAVIMAITDRDDRLLLGHAVGWPDLQFSVPAGFVEPGESLEAAVRREVREETGIVVGEVTYGGSQPWPFPASLMLGFFGRALTTEPTPDGVEVTEAMFLTREEVTARAETGRIRLPRATSIAHHLISEWYGRPLPRTATSQFRRG